MSTTPSGPAPISPASSPRPAAGGGIREGLEDNMRSGANWFLIIAGLSTLNFALELFRVPVRMLFGLGVTQVLRGIEGKTLTASQSLAVSAAFLVILVLCGVWARKASQGAFFAGILLYAMDGALLFYFSDWLGGAVHLYALFRMWQGLSACRELAALLPDAAVSPS